MGTNSLTENQIFNLISKFKIDGQIASVRPFGSGHINDTYRAINSDPSCPDYLLQRINHYVFKDVALLMSNLVNVTSHLKAKLSGLPIDVIQKAVLTVLETKNNEPYFKDDTGNYWRIFYFLTETKSYDMVSTERQAYEGGKAFGRFQAMLADMDVSLVRDSIPNFHNIKFRLDNLEKAVTTNKAGRLQEVLPEIEFIRNHADQMSEILRLGESGALPKRIVHNDTKFNNVLLDSEDHAQCVIDLDTVMPGYVAYDFGDSIRTIINTAAEDEKDIDAIKLNIPLFEAYTKGYLEEAHTFLTQTEINSLIKGVLLLPYIQAVRFLTDYLEGDVYFKVHSPKHNLQRARAQLTLVKKLEENQETLNRIILKTLEKYK